MSVPPTLSSDSAYDKTSLIKRTLPKWSSEQLDNIYSIRYIVDYIAAHGYHSPCLQFPDQLVQDAGYIATAIDHEQKSRGLSVRAPYVLADSSYSPCCIDETAAEHVSADLLVHFGNACLNPPRNVPVLYANMPAAPSEVIEKLAKAIGNETEALVYADTDAMETAFELGRRCPKLIVSTPIPADFVPPLSVKSTGEESEVLPKRTHPVTSTKEVIYLSRNPFDSLLLNMSTNFNKIIVADPDNGKVSVPRTALQRRYKLVHQARAAGTVGILVNTLSLRLMSEVLEATKRWIKAAGKKYYVFVVGKPNIPKLANFEMIDIWVILGCPLGGIIMDSSEYYRPIVTPFELKLALDDQWTGDWIIKLEDILSLPDPKNDESTEKNEEPLWDPVTGRLISTNAPLRRLQHVTIGEDNALQHSSSALVVKNTVSTAAEHLNSRSWKGLGSDHTDGQEEEYAQLKTGRSGIARDYNNNT